MTTAVETAAAYMDVVLGTRPGFVAIAYGHDGYFNQQGTYKFRPWIERSYR